MQSEGDFDQIRRQVFDTVKSMLADRRPEQPPVTTSDVATEMGLEMPLAVRAVQSLAEDRHLDVRSGADWQIAEIQGARRGFSGLAG